MKKLKVGIEGAAFVEAYSRRAATRLAQSINKDATLDVATAKVVQEQIVKAIDQQSTRVSDGR